MWLKNSPHEINLFLRDLYHDWGIKLWYTFYVYNNKIYINRKIISVSICKNVKKIISIIWFGCATRNKLQSMIFFTNFKIKAISKNRSVKILVGAFKEKLKKFFFQIWWPQMSGLTERFDKIPYNLWKMQDFLRLHDILKIGKQRKIDYFRLEH